MMTTNNEDGLRKSTTEALCIGFRKIPKDLEQALIEQEYQAYSFRKNQGREPGTRYRCINQKTGGSVYVLYQQGKDQSPHYSPCREEGNISALLRVDITTGIIPGSSDQPLIEQRDALVTYILDRYREASGAFLYIPQAVQQREIA